MAFIVYGCFTLAAEDMNTLTRRHVLASPAALAAAAATPRRMTMHLSCGAIGVKANQREALDYAARFGFESIDAYAGELGRMSAAELDEFRARMREKNIQWAIAGLPVEFRKDEDQFAAGLKELPAFAATLEKAGVTRVTTWIMPCHPSLTFLENFRLHARRLLECTRVLHTHGCRLGLEYVGPKTLWTSQRYAFVHTLREMKELTMATGKPGAGIVLDSWHWYTAGDTVADLKTFAASDVMSVDINDAPAGIAVDRQVDSVRELPCATGGIDLATFLRTLDELGCDAPVRCEPFNEALRRMPAETALAATAAALKKAFALLSS